MTTSHRFWCAVLLVLSLATQVRAADETSLRDWNTTGELAALEATQAAAADMTHYYAVANAVVAKYDRATGQRVALSEGESCKHLNSALLSGGKFYLAHSNYPAVPENSRIMTLDPATMQLATYHDFGASDGSLTWCIRRSGLWYCFFAFYGDKNAQGYLARFDDAWKETARWGLPKTLVARLGTASLSGGIWDGDELLCTGHDDPILFRLRIPRAGKELEYVGDERVAFTGQGFARDPKTGGLIGISRPGRKMLFASTKVVVGAPRLRVLSYNIHHAEGEDRKLDIPRIAAIIEKTDADIVALQEVDQNVLRSKNIDQAAELGRLTDLRPIMGGNIDLQGGTYGNALLSRYPIIRSTNHKLPNVDQGEQRGVLEAELEVPGIPQPLLFLATHFDHRRAESERMQSVNRIAELVKKDAETKQEQPMILAGDLNDGRASTTLKKLGELWTIAGEREQPTIPADVPTKQIDFILYRPAARWRVIETRVLDEPIASDHRPILSVLEWVEPTRR